MKIKTVTVVGTDGTMGTNVSAIFGKSMKADSITSHLIVSDSSGLIGCGHPIGSSGARMFVDIYKLETGKTRKYQVKVLRMV